MLAGCSSSTLLSPRHRLRTESPATFQACYFQLPSPMNTQRLDLPCGNFSRRDAASPRSQPMRPVGVAMSVEKPIEPKKSAGCSIKQHIRLPPLATAAHAVAAAAAAAGTATSAFVEEARRSREFWDRGGGGRKKSLKRFAEEEDGSACAGRAKRKRGGESEFSEEGYGGGEGLGLAQLGGGGGGFWFQPSFGATATSVPFSITCSGEEEGRLCFIPNDVVSPRLPVSSIPWVESGVTEITDLGENDVETSSHRLSPGKEASSGGGSSSSSESQQSLTLHLNEAAAAAAATTTATSEHEAGNGSSRSTRQEENQGLEIVSLLTACVEAIGSKNIPAVNHLITRLGDLASPMGPTLSRVAAYYTEALALRAARLWPHIFHVTVPRELDRAVDDDNYGTALRLLNRVSPIPKFVHFTANEIILRAFEGKDRVHVIDFDIKQGLQWPGLLQSLAARSSPPSHVRITGIGDSKQDLIETGERLASFAHALNLPLDFHPVVDRLEDVRLWMLHVKEGETVAVNCMFQIHKTLHDSSGGAVRDFLGLIRSTNPGVLVMAEQESRTNFKSLEARVASSLRYYAAVFDSVDYSGLPAGERVKIEEMYAREIRNIVACEGSDRVERHEEFETWKKLMEEEEHGRRGGGFRSFGIGDRERLQAQMILRMYDGEQDGFRVEERVHGSDRVGITLSWRGQPLHTVSAWASGSRNGCTGRTGLGSR